MELNSYIYYWKILSVDPTHLSMLVEYHRENEESIRLNVSFPRSLNELDVHVKSYAPEYEWNFIDSSKLINPDDLVNKTGSDRSTPIMVNTIGTSPIVFLTTPEVIV